ncbi:hypothetical protein CBR_g8899 [Chara braunii]|uniref:Uncharacterized protein n=1 Tax=Chara braunii TaxID=69332 RepID=A0A388KNG2_CHABU|nr:hypothetical protein CBR_g8899 [Chara braunii]|eukprot:GBG71483.1 hypothetical protein CBR_g8899 [Chara braunii]
MADTPNSGPSSESSTSGNAEPLPVCPVQEPNESLPDLIQRVQDYTAALTLAKERQEAAKAESLRLAAEAAAEAQRQAEADQLATDQLNADSAELLLSSQEQWTAVLNGMRYVPVAGTEPTTVQQERQNLADILLNTMRAVIWNSTMGELHSKATRRLQQDLNHNVKTLAAAIKVVDSQLKQLDARIATLEARPPQAAPGCTTDATKQLNGRIDHVVNLIGDLGAFTGPDTISSTVAAIKTDITKLQTRPDAATKNFKMPQFTISKFDDYNKTDGLTWWQGFLTEASCRTVPAEDVEGALPTTDWKSAGMDESPGGYQTMHHRRTPHAHHVEGVRAIMGHSIHGPQRREGGHERGVHLLTGKCIDEGKEDCKTTITWFDHVLWYLLANTNFLYLAAPSLRARIRALRNLLKKKWRAPILASIVFSHMRRIMTQMVENVISNPCRRQGTIHDDPAIMSRKFPRKMAALILPDKYIKSPARKRRVQEKDKRPTKRQSNTLLSYHVRPVVAEARQDQGFGGSQQMADLASSNMNADDMPIQDTPQSSVVTVQSEHGSSVVGKQLRRSPRYSTARASLFK